MAKAEEEKTAEATPKKSNKLVLGGGIVGGMLVFMVVGVFVGIKIFGQSPTEAMGIEIVEQHGEGEHPESQETAEIPIAKIRCPHTNTNRLYVIEMEVHALVPKHLLGGGEGEGGGHGGHGGEAAGGGIEEEIKHHEATIRDRMRTIIAGADAGALGLARTDKPDYGLSTLRRQFKGVLEELIGKGNIQDVLIAHYMPTPID